MLRFFTTYGHKQYRHGHVVIRLGSLFFMFKIGGVGRVCHLQDYSRDAHTPPDRNTAGTEEQQRWGDEVTGVKEGMGGCGDGGMERIEVGGNGGMERRKGDGYFRERVPFWCIYVRCDSST